MAKELTPQSIRVLTFIKEYIDREKFSPSQLEIAEHFNHNSHSAIQKTLHRLEQLGLIERIRGKSRSIRLKKLD